VLGGLSAALFGTLLGGLVWRQLLLYPTYEIKERNQILRQVLEPGPRGNILDRQGRVLVENRARYSVVLYVNELRDEFQKEFYRLRDQWRDQHHDDFSEVEPTMDSNELAQEARVNVAQRYLNIANTLLGRQAVLDSKEFERHFQQNLLLPFTLINDVTPEEYARFNEQMPVTSPLQTYVQAERYYPYGSLAAHTLGFVGVTNDVNEIAGEDELIAAELDLPKNDTFTYLGKIGRDGLELSHESQLRGQPGGEKWIVDPSGFQCTRTWEKAPQQGPSFTCSLDVNVQRAAEKAFGNYTGAAVAMDVRTGEVLAMASKPDYDLNDSVPYITQEMYNEIYARGGWLNRATGGLYPPGSTFKLVDSVAGLRAGIIDGSTAMECGPTLLIGNREFKENSPYGYGHVDLEMALQKSCNVFFYQQGMNIGVQKLAAEARRFGLDQPTGIDVNETHDMIVPDAMWKKTHRPDEGPWLQGDTAMMAIGQSYLLVTPLQMACLAASLARDETRTTPTLVHNPNLAPGTIIHGGVPTGLTPVERQLLLAGMERCVEIGTGVPVHKLVPNVRVAGKTGTAQVIKEGKENTIAWFVGFAPIDNPRIAVAVAVEGTDPRDNYHGGTVAGPIAGAMLAEYFKDYPGDN
jgi:penicillin-binding protein 2